MIFNEKYLIRWGTEAAWGVLIAVVSYVGVQLAAADLETLDPAALAVSIATGAGRVALAVLINSVRKLFTGS